MLLDLEDYEIGKIILGFWLSDLLFIFWCDFFFICSNYVSNEVKGICRCVEIFSDYVYLLDGI